LSIRAGPVGRSTIACSGNILFRDRWGLWSKRDWIFNLGINSHAIMEWITLRKTRTRRGKQTKGRRRERW
jgi:hypothetical protein